TQGTWGGDCDVNAGVTVALGETKTCTITNDDQPASVQGGKYNDINGNGNFDENEVNDDNRLDGWTINLYDDEWTLLKSMVTGNGSTPAGPVEKGQFKFIGLSVGEYYVCEVQNSLWTQTEPNADTGFLSQTLQSYCHEIELSLGQNLEGIQFGNFDNKTITGYKFSDLDGNGSRDEGDDPIEGWEITLCRYDPLVSEDELLEAYIDESCLIVETTSTDENGRYEFTGLGPGTYKISEEQRSYFNVISPASGEYDNIDINSLRESYDFYNQPVLPELTISKTNNSNSPQSPGDSVGFIIVVNVLGSNVDDVIVTDLLSDGFKYRSGSWEVVSDFDGPVATLEPTYASPGKWFLGDMKEGDTYTLTYIADIQSDVDAGTYKDLAWVKGTDFWEGNVLGQAVEPGVVNTAFVGTAVEVVTPNPDPEAEAEVDEEEITEEVLGTSTIRLPATGSDTVILISALLIMILGILMTAISRKKRFMPIVVAMFFTFVLGAGKVYAETPNLTVLIEDPETSFNEPFKITFVAMDLLGDGDLTAYCEKDGPNDPGWVEYDSTELSMGGNTGVCDVTSGVLNGTGSYKFRVKVIAEWEDSVDETVYSNEVTTTYDNDGPDKPKYIEVDRKSDCKYEITLKTANDSQTDYVEVYMSDEKEFTAGPGSRIRTFDMGPDEKKTFTEEVGGEKCAHRQYFAIRAFDSSGNGSDVEAEELVDVNTVTINKEEVIYEASIASTGGSSIGPGEGNENAEVVPTEEEIGGGEEGSVLGEQAQEQGGQKKSFFGKLLSSPWTWVVLVILLGGLTINGLRKRNE
ncbi:MAG: Cna B domain protein, partial [candidate division WWE3 bacterium GW2011_GWE2_43_18]